VAIITVGAVITFAHHPDYFRSRPALSVLTAADAHFPSTPLEVMTAARIDVAAGRLGASGGVRITDVALDPYTSHGHDGLLQGHRIINDATVEVLVAQALNQARAGADIIITYFAKSFAERHGR